MEQIIATLESWFEPQVLGALLATWGGRVLAALAVFVVGRWIVGMIVRWLGFAMQRAEVDATLTGFLGNLLRVTLMVLVLLTAAGVLGIPTTNFLAIIGAAGLAVGLALKDSLSNFSAGVMLVLFRPFRAGDFIDAAGVAGTVESIGIFKTDIKTPDNRVIVVPNSLIYGGTITNFSAKDTRRIDLVIGISYDDEIHKARSLIQAVLDGDDRVLKDPAAQIMLLELGASSVDIAVRPWVNSADYWTVRADMLERIKVTLEDNGLSIPYPQRDVHIVSSAAASV
ncbi:MAG TPA: mechanosensitive ion channel domain-containing protein [Gammaproteobacteria bacterium]|nr:mechanosensitive ion channel domain-containing protein [Gammaproteobacteria bacterium]